MKRNSLILKRIYDASYLKSIGISCALLSLLTSCAWMTKRKTLFSEDEEKGKVPVSAMVTKTQYDQLLAKYENLLKKVNEAEASKKSAVLSPFEGNDPSEIVNQLSKVKPPSDLVETVDVFQGPSGKGSGHNEDLLANISRPDVSDDTIENQIIQLRKAISLIDQNKFEAALNILKELENSNVAQIQVHSKFYLGEMLFLQKEYDLAMQIFEELIGKYAFSGSVIKALGRLIVCSEKLKLNKKKEKYYSILHDFFEST